MRASILDLRYKTRDILAALGKGEKVTVTERGKDRGVIIPLSGRTHQRIEDHDFFGMNAGSVESVAETMNRLRGQRYDL